MVKDINFNKIQMNLEVTSSSILQLCEISQNELRKLSQTRDELEGLKYANAYFTSKN